MGMPGLTTSDIISYSRKPNKSNHKMTVSELRNYVNPITGYYDFMSAESFINDPSISKYDKVVAIYGDIVSHDNEKIIELFNKLDEVVNNG